MKLGEIEGNTPLRAGLNPLLPQANPEKYLNPRAGPTYIPRWIANDQGHAECRKTQKSEHPLGIGVNVKHHPDSAAPQKKEKGGQP